ncbi:MAG: hypothetical protein ACSLFP_19265 [Acidimicrobiales bacterium]
MADPLDVLVIESSPHAADLATADLVAAGHRVHRCHDHESRGFPCVGVAEPGSCPLDQSVDVALIVRPRVSPRPTQLEGGVSCALRVGVPIVEQGPEVLDPFAPWVSRRVDVGDDLSAAIYRAVHDGFAPLRELIRTRIAPLTSALGVHPAAVGCRIERAGMSLDVHLDLPSPASPALSQALAVRVLDAVRSMGRTAGNVDVFVHDPNGSTLTG